ncbi:hypothetical protein F4809DRAFT_186378 [Biscogniauxia mediterranea]|nr:hypothetical protein F4809DRAFT_186378 [Biscogniauxia mediterranea]
MLAVQPRRWLSRPKGLLIFAITAATLYWFLLHGAVGTRVGTWTGESDVSQDIPVDASKDGPGESEDGQAVEVEKSAEEKMQEQEAQRQESLRQQFKMEHEELGKAPGADAIFGETLNTLDSSKPRSQAFEKQLTPSENLTYFSTHRPYVYNPYPEYNSKAWRETRAPYVPCEGPSGEEVDDLLVFKGVPKNFPAPGIGSYSVLNMDGDLCFERETRFGPYGFQNANDTSEPAMEWNKVRWGRLQDECVKKNKARYDMHGKSNPYLGLVEKRDLDTQSNPVDTRHSLRRRPAEPNSGRGVLEKTGFRKAKATTVTEARSALLLRTYTGKEYNENDKQVIRSLVTELSLRTGGQYQVFLFVHVKDTSYAIWDDESVYQAVLEQAVPPEFRDMAILWNDEATQGMYTKLDPEKATVHVAQWLSVQKFSQEFPEFEYIWNWEMDARITGQHYDFLEKMASFAKRQPRRGLWERNERYYIPSLHGDYDTAFRKEVEQLTAHDTIWGPPELPFIKPVGPKPPVAKPEDDNYKWGVGEEADLITVAPIFEVQGSGWIGGNDVWGFNDSSHETLDLPRRATIVTHSRISKRLLDIMHVENLRGNHIASEMTCQTVSLLHGLKAVYAPMPIYFDRPWSGKDLARWFNNGPRGDSGGSNSAMGWGREARYGGSTWYYRATPPQRLYNNMMGYEDAGIGGEDWEEQHGRTCLPPILMHPIKDVEPTEPGYHSESILPFG